MKKKAHDLFEKGVESYNEGDFEKAIKYFEKALEIYKDTGNKAEQVKCYKNIGAAYQELGDIKAGKYFWKAVEINREIGGPVIF